MDGAGDRVANGPVIDGKDRDHAGERGGQCFGGGPLIDLEEALYRFIRFERDVVVEQAGKRP